MDDCTIRENCQNLGRQCHDCADYEMYWPEKTNILSPRQVKEREKRKAEKKQRKQSEASKRGKYAKRKGYRTEKKIAKILNGERVPLSGALGGKYTNDVIVKDWKLEVKARADGWKEIRRWVHDKRENPDAVVLVPDREEPLIVMTISRFKLLLGG